MDIQHCKVPSGPEIDLKQKKATRKAERTRSEGQFVL